MPIRLFNTLTRQKETFVAISPGKVGMYVCGPTVYSYSHIGHMVGPVIFDAVKRWLIYSGYKVTYVVNITDIDDKIIQQAAKENCSISELSRRVVDDYWECLKKLEVSVDEFPHATEHMSGILTMIAGLVEKGHAYPAGGDVYFEVATHREYGKLTNRKLDDMLSGVRKEVNDLKRSPGDFALWKGAKPGEPAWESPWGPGRPGWHIECSAMSKELLGETFDIHGGGLDLQFPHHEDEIAQSECFTGKPFARYWMHNGLLQMPEGKMSKSLGNAVTVRELFNSFTPEQLRFFLLSTHYRSPIDFREREASIEKCCAGLPRLHTLRDRIERLLGIRFSELPAPESRSEPTFDTSIPLLAAAAELRDRFTQAMDDDFNTAGAIGVLFEFVPVLNKFADDAKLDAGAGTAVDKESFRVAAVVFRELTRLLGLLSADVNVAAVDDALTGPLLDLLLEIRNDARKSKNFALADVVRTRLASLGVVIEDSAQGSRWKKG